MSTTLHVSAALLVIAVVAVVFVIVYPFVLGVIARKKLGVGWRYFCFGVLVFLVFQLLTRLPLLAVLNSTVLASLLRTSIAFTWFWLVVEAVTAGIFEEVGRYVGYGLFMGREPKTWAKAVMYGIGHEAVESVVLVGVEQILLTLLSIAILSVINVNGLPATQKQTFIEQVTYINSLPVWYPLLAIWGDSGAFHCRWRCQ